MTVTLQLVGMPSMIPAAETTPGGSENSQAAMLTHHRVEHAKSYLDAHLGQRVERTPRFLTQEGPFVTISRESGSGGTTLAHLLADKLNDSRADDTAWTVFDHDIVERMLEDQHLSRDLAKYLPERRVSEVDAVIREIVGLHPNLWTLVQKTNALIGKIARSGHAILVGRGARFATAGIHNGLHLRLVASKAHRAAITAARLRLRVTDAAVENRRVDEARAGYVRSIFDANVADPAAYDLVFNTGQIPLREIAEILRDRIPQPVRPPARAD